MPATCYWTSNFYPNPEVRYRGLVPDTCCTLLGPRFVLLRPEFA